MTRVRSGYASTHLRTSAADRTGLTICLGTFAPSTGTVFLNAERSSSFMPRSTGGDTSIFVRAPMMNCCTRKGRGGWCGERRSER